MYATPVPEQNRVVPSNPSRGFARNRECAEGRCIVNEAIDLAMGVE